ncbi:YceI family protein [Actinospica robiniae]|uniref:YceI family protein n=1 Tax=Actinospica robiniae TaxID=304901 RepID=UPI00041520B2|nr:YceI family protein [Actinospica robiniae]
MPLTPEPGHWQLDPARSTVRFRHKTFWGLVTVKGRFSSVSGEGEVSPSGAATGTLTVDSASLSTRLPMRDKHLRSADFLDAENHAAIVFTARGITPREGDTVEVEGTLTVRGTTRPLSFTARAEKADGDAIALRGNAAIDREEYGLTWNQIGMIRGLTSVAVDLYFAPSA